MTERPLFHRAYGAALDRLPAPIRIVHDINGERTWHGRVTIERGASLLSRIAGAVMGFPAAALDQPLGVRMRNDGIGEEWARSFDGRSMASRLAAGPDPGTIVERLWPMAATSRLEPDAAGVTQRLAGLRVLGVPVPRALWPHLDVREGAEGTHYTFRMRIVDPWGGLIVAYHGWLETAPASPGERGASKQ